MGSPADRVGDRGPEAGSYRPFALLALGLLAVGLSSWQAVPAGVWHDDGVYMTVGQALSRGDGLVYGGVPGTPPAVKFPPGYSALLAFLWLVLPGVGSVTLVATVLNVVLLALAGGVLAWTLHRHGGVDRDVALAAGGLGFLSGDVWRLALVPMSESLFVALTFAALALATRAGAEDRRAHLRVGLVLAAAVLTRSAAVAVVAGVAAPLLLRRRWRSASAVLLPPVAAFVAWSAWSGRHAAEVPPELSDVLGGYQGWLVAQLVEAPDAFLTGLPGHALTLLSRQASLLLPGTPTPPLWALALLLPVAGVGAWELRRKVPALPWIVGFYALMLVVWPFVDRRLMAPLLPLLVALIVVGGVRSLEALARPALRHAWIAVMFLWVGAFSAVSAWRISEGWAAHPYRLRAERLAAGMEALGRVAGPDAVVGAPEYWAAMHLHGGWRAAPSARFKPRAAGGSPVWGTPGEQLATWAVAGIDHLLLEQGGAVHGDALNLLEERCPGAVRILAELPPQMVVRLEPGPACPWPRVPIP